MNPGKRIGLRRLPKRAARSWSGNRNGAETQRYGQSFQVKLSEASSTAQQFRPGQIVPLSSPGRFGVSEDDNLGPAAIGSLHDGARRRGMMVDPYRDLVQATADDAGVTFERALQLIKNFDTMPPDEFKAFAESLVMLTEEATRHGVSIGRFVTIMLSDGAGKSPARH
jgi:hypothetical protein